MPVIRGVQGRVRLLLGALLLLTLLRGLAHWPAIVESVYANGIAPRVGRGLAALSGLVSISLAEPVLLALALWVVIAMGASLARVLRGRERPLETLGRGALSLAVATAVVAVLFYLLWGLHYARPELAKRLGWSGASPPGAAAPELIRLCEELVHATNGAYEEAVGGRDLGRPTTLPVPVEVVDADLDAGYDRIARRLGFGSGFGRSRGRAKPVALSLLLNHLNLGGFYFPWTGEANYNRLVPACSLPHTIAHEKAHQRGIAAEDEAHFLGFLAAASSDAAYVRYSAYLFAQSELLAQLYTADRRAYGSVVARRDPGVARDVAAEAAFWSRYRGAAAAASRAVNDGYLKAQGIRDGVDSYGRSARLLVLFARANGGSGVVASR